MNRYRLINIINDTIDKCQYEYKWMIDDAKNIFYDENSIDIKLSRIKSYSRPNIKIIKETTIEAIINNNSKVYAVLNFASAKSPGGGVLKGAVAQEESLSRSSTLYPVIKQCTEFYTTINDSIYSDKIIYSKPIYIIKDDYGDDINPIKCEVITCAAPDYRWEDFDIYEHENVMNIRFAKVLKSAILNNRRNIILGAWGCGVFKNPPEINAKIFRSVIDNFSNFFDDIIFAIPDDKNYTIFKNII